LYERPLEAAGSSSAKGDEHSPAFYLHLAKRSYGKSAADADQAKQQLAAKLLQAQQKRKDQDEKGAAGLQNLREGKVQDLERVVGAADLDRGEDTDWQGEVQDLLPRGRDDGARRYARGDIRGRGDKDLDCRRDGQRVWKEGWRRRHRRCCRVVSRAWCRGLRGHARDEHLDDEDNGRADAKPKQHERAVPEVPAQQLRTASRRGHSAAATAHVEAMLGGLSGSPPPGARQEQPRKASSSPVMHDHERHERLFFSLKKTKSSEVSSSRCQGRCGQ